MAPGLPQWIKRFAWFVLLWTSGVLALSLIAYGLRLFMRMAGLADTGL